MSSLNSSSSSSKGSISGKGSGSNSKFSLSRPPTTLSVPGLTRSKTNPNGTISSNDIGSKLAIVMVGLPARGKSYITNKVSRYLNWCQHDCKIFNVGNTRRQSKENSGPFSVPLTGEEDKKQDDEHDANFFNPDNAEFSALRDQWAMETLDEMLDYIIDGPGSVGIFDATNTTKRRRKRVLEKIKQRSNGELKVLFMESICTKPSILEENIRLKLSGPDYKDINIDIALKDFLERMKNYEKAYETIDDDEADSDDSNLFQYVKMINVGKKVVSYNIQGYLAGQAVYFLTNFNLTDRQIWITRHGESADNRDGKIGGDAPLTEKGEKYSNALASFIDYKQKEFRKRQLKHFEDRKKILPSAVSIPESSNYCVWSSMLKRTIQTASSFDETRYFPKEMRMLNELGSGICDGLTYKEIEKKYPEEYMARKLDKLRYRYPGIGGESYLDVINRLKPVITEVERMEDSAIIIAHRVVCRVLLAYFMNLDRSLITDLSIPLHSVFVLEPKPYGVDWAMYKYDEESDWFYQVKHNLPPNAFAKAIPLEDGIFNPFKNIRNDNNDKNTNITCSTSSSSLSSSSSSSLASEHDLTSSTSQQPTIDLEEFSRFRLHSSSSSTSLKSSKSKKRFDEVMSNTVEQLQLQLQAHLRDHDEENLKDHVVLSNSSSNYTFNSTSASSGLVSAIETPKSILSPDVKNFNFNSGDSPKRNAHFKEEMESNINDEFFSI